MFVVPESLRLSLPSPKVKGKRVSGGRDKRETPAKGAERAAPPVSPTAAEAMEPVQPGAARQEEGLQDITAGLVSLNLDNSTSSPASVPVGGARRKVRPGSQENPVKGPPSAQVTPEKKEVMETVSSTPPQDKMIKPVSNLVLRKCAFCPWHKFCE